MKNYKVRATRNFNDAEEKVARTKDDEFCCSKERYEVLKSKNAVELVEIVEEENEFIMPIIGHRKDDVENIIPLDEEAMEKVAETIGKYIEEVEEQEEKPKKKRTTKKSSKG